MAKKSTNTQGNPWHSEENGQFVSKNETAYSSNNSFEEDEAMSLFEGKIYNYSADVSNKIKKWKERKTEKNNDILSSRENFKEAQNAEEAMRIGNSYFGRNVCYYDFATDKDSLNQMNKALYDVMQDFPNVFNTMLTYGNTNSNINSQVIREEIKKNISKVAKIINEDIPILQNFLSGFVNEYHYLGEGANAIKPRMPYGSTLGSWNYEPGAISNNNRNLFAGIRINNTYSLNSKKAEIAYPIESSGPRKEGSIYFTSSHELGHHIHLTIYQNHFSLSEKEELKKLIDSVMVGGVSKYAKTDRDECVAEAFADYYSNHGEPYYQGNKKIVEYIKGKYNQYLKDL